ncbi:MAG TPA: Uma2 family endonuclease [Candidatus Baltobacteraceae bacterium]|jgi:Uma2 family endonuclease|nr:Uma2 family endonuclease [Candidatus Baltobacteraceae bacterium]
MASAFPSRRPISDRELELLSCKNSGVRYERSAEGELIVTPPTGEKGGLGEGELYFQLRLWASSNGRGIATLASLGIELPNKAVVAPDAAWVSFDRYNAIPEEAHDEGYMRAVPEVTFELLSKGDKPDDVQAKVKQYLANGVKLVVLLDPRSRSAELYRPGAAVEPHPDVETISLDPELPGFSLDVKEIFDLTTIRRSQRMVRKPSKPARSRRS